MSVNNIFISPGSLGSVGHLILCLPAYCWLTLYHTLEASMNVSAPCDFVLIVSGRWRRHRTFQRGFLYYFSFIRVPDLLSAEAIVGRRSTRQEVQGMSKVTTWSCVYVYSTSVFCIEWHFSFRNKVSREATSTLRLI